MTIHPATYPPSLRLPPRTNLTRRCRRGAVLTELAMHVAEGVLRYCLSEFL